jgi:parallel beta-helix repeat protein
MDGLHRRVNFGKAFIGSAVVAALFAVLFPIGAMGTNPFTVWHVSKSSSNVTCTISNTTCNTISSATEAASDGDVILVGPGTYNESVDIEKYNLTFRGAQAGRDARTRRFNPNQESIVDATGKSGAPGYGAAFYIDQYNAVIDGFTLQGGTAGDQAAGIYDDNDWTLLIVNNIIQNNAVGVYLYDTYYSILEHNLIRNNNTGTAGSYDNGVAGMSGFGIVAYGSTSDDLSSGDSITGNAFCGNLATAAYLDNASAVMLTRNTSKGDGSFLVTYLTSECVFSENQGEEFATNGLPLPNTSPLGKANAAIDVGYQNNGLLITDNDLEEGKARQYSGIDFATYFGLETGLTADYNNEVCNACQIKGNKIARFAGNGIVAEASATAETGTLYESTIAYNDVSDNGLDGILIGDAPYNIENTLVSNEAKGNHTNDCEDDTLGTWTAGTYSSWYGNIGLLSSLPGLCNPGTPW